MYLIVCGICFLLGIGLAYVYLLDKNYHSINHNKNVYTNSRSENNIDSTLLELLNHYMYKEGILDKSSRKVIFCEHIPFLNDSSNKFYLILYECNKYSEDKTLGGLDIVDQTGVIRWSIQGVNVSDIYNTYIEYTPPVPMLSYIDCKGTKKKVSLKTISQDIKINMIHR